MPITDADQLTPLEDLFNASSQEAKDYADDLLAAPQPHIFRLQNTAQTLTTSLQTKLTGFGTVVDSAVGITYSAGDWAVAKTGVYSVVAQVGFDSNASGDRRAYLYIGGSQISRTTSDANSTTVTVLPVSAQMKLNAGDVVSLRALHTRGSNLDTSPVDTQMSISWLHP